VIAAPHNDRQCLDAITAEIRARLESGDPELTALAAEHEDTDSLVDYIQGLPQRDDTGSPCDGPKVEACRPAQRLRLPTETPNCVERSALYIALAEMIDPGPVRRLATVNTPNGMHTFPTQDGEPVILDPMVSRNALRAGLFRARRNSALKSPGLPPDVATRRLRIERLIGTDETKGVRGDLARARKSKAAGYTTWVHGEPIDDAIAKYERALVTYQKLLDELPRNAPEGRPLVTLTPTEAVDWISSLAAEPGARFVNGTRRVRNGHRAMRDALDGRPLCVADVPDVAFVLALADREATQWGPSGRRIVQTCAHAIDRLDQAAARRWLDERAPRNLRIGRYQVRPNTPLIAALGRVGARLGGNVAVQAIRVKLAAMGVTPMVLGPIEQELNREGLSLGALAAPPPMLGSLAALTPDAIAGRWLASKI